VKQRLWHKEKGDVMKIKLLIAVLVAVVVSFVAVGAATALPLTQSRPFQAICEAQGGTFVDASSSFIFCMKQDFVGFTPTQLHLQRTLCEQVYGATFRVEVFPNDPLPGITFFSECFIPA
jgi:hypothetical protein